MEPGADAWIIPTRGDHHAASEGARAILDAFVRSGQRDFALALSGGRIAPVLFGELVRQARARGVPMERADIFWADERCVRPDDAESNYLPARKHLLEPLGFVPERVHRLQGELPPEQAAERANADWEAWASRRGDRGAVLDCVLLGVGEDGHVASLFPGNLPQDLASEAAFRAVIGPKPPPQRLTMGYPLLWSARRVVVVVGGPGKTEIVHRSLAGTADTPLARVLRGRARRDTILIGPISPRGDADAAAGAGFWRPA